MALAGSQSQACLSNTYRTSSDSCSSSSESESARRRRNVFPVIRIAEPDSWSCVTRRVVQGTSLFRRAKVSSERRLHSDPPLPCQATPQARTAPPQQGRHPLRKARAGTRWDVATPSTTPQRVTTLTVGRKAFEPHSHAPAARPHPLLPACLGTHHSHGHASGVPGTALL